jgi:poly(glycerol-phosphate) alpha-glucosyltransferase
MKVGILAGSLADRAGGVAEALRGLVPAMHRPPDWEFRIVGLRDAGGPPSAEAWTGIPMRIFDVRGPRSFGYASGLAGGLDGLDLRHVHGLWMYSSVVARRWARRRVAPYIISPHGMLDAWAIGNGRWKKRLATAWYEGGHLRGSACLHALCAAELQAIRDFGLVNPVCVIPNGVAEVNRADFPPPAWRVALPPDAKVLLYLGRIHPKKGLPNLIGALARCDAAARSGRWRLAVAGWDQGGHQAELEAAAAAAGIADRVHFIGPQFGRDKDATLHAADAFVLPSYSEGLPMAVLEAWAHGLPVLMTPQCNLPEGPAHGAALSVDPAVDSLTGGLSALFGLSNDERTAMGRRGAALGADRFTWPVVGRRMQDVYRWLLGQGGRPDCVELV